MSTTSTKTPFDALDEEYAEKKKNLLATTATKLVTALNSAVSEYEAIPADKRKDVMKQDAIVEVLKKLGLKFKKGKRKAMSAESKAKIAAAQAKRWKNKKKSAPAE